MDIAYLYLNVNIHLFSHGIHSIIYSYIYTHINIVIRTLPILIYTMYTSHTYTYTCIYYVHTPHLIHIYIYTLYSYVYKRIGERAVRFREDQRGIRKANVYYK